MENFSVELIALIFQRLFFLNLSKNFQIDEFFSTFSDQVSPSASGQVTLEPPTPPRTPVITSQGLPKSAEKNYNNNNDDAEENYEGNSSSHHGTKIKSNLRVTKSDREYEKYPRLSSQLIDDWNMSDQERGDRESVASESLLNRLGEESDPEGSDCASSFDSSKLSLKNIENFLDKSPMVSSSRVTQNCHRLPTNLINFQSFYNPMMHLNTLQSDQAEKQLIGECFVKIM